MDSKKPWHSKTVWVNILMALGALYPPVQKFLTPEMMGVLFGLVNLVLRLVTKKEIKLLD